MSRTPTTDPKMSGGIFSKMEPELEARVREVARKADLTMSSFVRQALRHELARLENRSCYIVSGLTEEDVARTPSLAARIRMAEARALEGQKE